MFVRPFGARELRALEEDQALALALALKGAHAVVNGKPLPGIATVSTSRALRQENLLGFAFQTYRRKSVVENPPFSIFDVTIGPAERLRRVAS